MSLGASRVARKRAFLSGNIAWVFPYWSMHTGLRCPGCIRRGRSWQWSLPVALSFILSSLLQAFSWWPLHRRNHRHSLISVEVLEPHSLQFSSSKGCCIVRLERAPNVPFSTRPVSGPLPHFLSAFRPVNWFRVALGLPQNTLLLSLRPETLLVTPKPNLGPPRSRLCLFLS